VGRINRTRGRNDNGGKSVEDMVPTRFHKDLSVFRRKSLSNLTLRKSWDSRQLKPNQDPAEKRNQKVYALSPKEQEDNDLINEQLRKG